MDNTVTPLRVVDNAPKQDVVNLLEELLQLARAGELRSIAVAVCYGPGNTGNSWAGLGESTHDLYAEISRLQFEFMRSWCEWSDEEMGRSP